MKKNFEVIVCQRGRLSPLNPKEIFTVILIKVWEVYQIILWWSDMIDIRLIKGGKYVLIIVLVGNPNRKKMHIFGFVGIFEYIC